VKKQPLVYQRGDYVDTEPGQIERESARKGDRTMSTSHKVWQALN
jgi:hypothetical protein